MSDETMLSDQGVGSEVTCVVEVPTQAAYGLAWSQDTESDPVYDETACDVSQSWGLMWSHAAVLVSAAFVIALVVGAAVWMVLVSMRPSNLADTRHAPPPLTSAPAPDSTHTDRAHPATPPTAVTVPPEPAASTTKPQPKEADPVLEPPRPTATATPETPPPTRASRAHDSTDEQFLAAVRSAHLNIYNPNEVLSTAHYVCSQLRQGADQSDEIRFIKTHGNVTDLGAIDFVADAVTYYCPEQGD